MLLTVSGLLLAALTIRVPPGRRARAAVAGLSVFAAYSTSALFHQGKAEVVTEMPAPWAYGAATGALTALLAAFAAACALAARTRPVNRWAAAALVAGLGLGAGLLGAARAGDGDTDGWILAASVLADALPIPLVLLLWWVASGRRASLRRAAAWVGILVLGAVLGTTLVEVGELATTLLRISPYVDDAGPGTLPGVVLIGAVLATVVAARSARGDRATAEAVRHPEDAPPPRPVPATGDRP